MTYIADTQKRDAIARASGILTIRIVPGSPFYTPLTTEQENLLEMEEAQNDSDNE